MAPRAPRGLRPGSGGNDRYDAADVHAAAADFGLVVVTTFVWGRGREATAYAVVTLGPGGTLLGGAIIETEVPTDVQGSVAGNGPYALVSVLPRGRPGQAILLGCPPRDER